VEDAGYTLNRLVPRPATLGVTQSPLFAAQTGLWDRGEALRVKLSYGTLSSADELSVLNGANAMAIGDGSTDNWEIFQFADVTLVAPGVYDVSHRLRGQLGTNGTAPDVWPPGSLVVLLDSTLNQIELAQSARGLVRNYRIGAAGRGVDDTSIIHKVEAFSGIGLRPYSPAHLSQSVQPNGDRGLSWIRRTRKDGDSWESLEVPLGETQEQYLIRIYAAGSIMREVTVGTTNWTYSNALQVADAAAGSLEVQVAQLSDRFGPGPFATLAL
jgi:hypothetical protein